MLTKDKIKGKGVNRWSGERERERDGTMNRISNFIFIT
jgi:hypothetical protein